MGRLESVEPSGRYSFKSRKSIFFVKVPALISLWYMMKPFTKKKKMNRNIQYCGLLIVLLFLFIVGIIAYNQSSFINAKKEEFELTSDVTQNHIHPSYRYERDENGRRQLVQHMVPDTNASQISFGAKLQQRLFNAFRTGNSDQNNDHQILRKGHRTKAIPMSAKGSRNAMKPNNALRYKSNQREWCRVDEPC